MHSKFEDTKTADRSLTNIEHFDYCYEYLPRRFQPSVNTRKALSMTREMNLYVPEINAGRGAV